VFIELFEKWATSEEKLAQIKSLVVEPLVNSPNIEVRPLDLEVLEELLRLREIEPHLDNHDMIVIASAIILEADLVTSDQKLADLAKKINISIFA
jgi:predicted nucleic acid-binding protein